jgi:hypothetical protein
MDKQKQLAIKEGIEREIEDLESDLKYRIDNIKKLVKELERIIGEETRGELKGYFTKEP